MRDIVAGDVAWVMVSTVLVLLMTGPGLALFYAGMVRLHDGLHRHEMHAGSPCRLTDRLRVIAIILAAFA